MAAVDPSSSSSNTDNENDVVLDPIPNANSSPNSSSRALVSVPSPRSAGVCLLQFACDSAAGAFMGSIFGFGMYPVLHFELLIGLCCKVLSFLRFFFDWFVWFFDELGDEVFYFLSSCLVGVLSFVEWNWVVKFWEF